MLNKYKTKREQGFTIIEVLIVLAIAGLIILIVFLAVPALQRNSRNTQYKNDASALISATTEFVNNNNGTLPVTGDIAAIKANAKTQAITDLNVQTGQGDITPTFDKATVATGVKCGSGAGAGTTVTPAASSTRSMIIVYAVEDSAGNVIAQCTES